MQASAEGIVVVTGASSGIGRAAAEAFLARGCRVLAAARRPERLADLAARGALTSALDVADDASIAALAARIAAEGLAVRVLVNNAGYGAMGPAAAVGAAALRRQFEVNAVGPLALVGALLPALGPGSLVANVGSVSGEFTTPWAGAYCASKAALHALTDALELELAPLGVRVMSVRPGAIASGFGDAAADSLPDLPAASPFAPYRAGMAARAAESQRGAAPAAALAAALAEACLRKRPPRRLRFGPKSRQLPLLRALLPGPLLRAVLAKRYCLAGRT